MSIDVANAPQSEITVAGLALSVPAPFSEGHPLRENEAAVLNQTYAENLRNNFAKTVKEAQVKAEAEGVDLDSAVLQAELTAYAATYDFGVRRGGSAVPADPVSKEAYNIASGKVKAALKKKGFNLKEVGAEKIRKIVDETLEKYPQIREQAQKIVAMRKDVGADALDLEV